MKDTYSIYLKAPCLEEALRIMFWCISANAKGDIQECQPELETSPPYLTMHLATDTRSEVLQLWKYFTKYLDAIKNGPQSIQTEVENYEKYIEECNGMSSKRFPYRLTMKKSLSKMALKMSYQCMKLNCKSNIYDNSQQNPN